MRIKAHDLVLEIGSGDNPNPRSDILLDMLLEDSSERVARRGLVIDRPLVVGQGEKLPFRDKSFDFIVACHVLEHAQDPGEFLREMVRVGKRGYIETPLPLRERVFNWSFHRWYVYVEGKKLIFIKKTSRSKKFFHEFADRKRRDLVQHEGRELKNLHFYWDKKIDFQVFESEEDLFLEELDQKLMVFWRKRKQNPGFWWLLLKSKIFKVKGVPEAGLAIKNSLFFLKRIFNQKLQAQSRVGLEKDKLLKLLVCPNCKVRPADPDLIGADNLRCLKCQKRLLILWPNSA